MGVDHFLESCLGVRELLLRQIDFTEHCICGLEGDAHVGVLVVNVFLGRKGLGVDGLVEVVFNKLPKSGIVGRADFILFGSQDVVYQRDLAPEGDEFVVAQCLEEFGLGYCAGLGFALVRKLVSDDVGVVDEFVQTVVNGFHPLVGYGGRHVGEL